MTRSDSKTLARETRSHARVASEGPRPTVTCRFFPERGGQAPAREGNPLACAGGIRGPTHSDYQSVAGFESKTGVKLPEDIAKMLTDQAERLSVPPMMINLFQRQTEIESTPFVYDAAAMLPRDNLSQHREA